MNQLSVVLALLTLCACDPNAPCRSLLGQKVPEAAILGAARLPPAEISGASYAGSENNYSLGPAVEQYCCSTPPQSPSPMCPTVNCTLPESTGIKTYTLGSPYTFEYGSDHGQSCQVSVKDGVVTAVWSHEWS